MENVSATPTVKQASLKQEWPLLFVAATALLFMTVGSGWLEDLSSLPKLFFMFVWLFFAILAAAFSVVRHAEALAVILGEPLGSLILTVSVISIEILMVSAVMLTGGSEPTMARDTMFAVTMIVLNGLLGCSLLLGGIRHHEQEYNLKGANAYLAVILPLAILGLILPNFTEATDIGTLSKSQGALVAAGFLLMYIVFLAIQTVRHRGFFMAPSVKDTNYTEEHHDIPIRSIPYHTIFLLAFLLPVVVLSKKLAIPMDYTVIQLGAPVALGGFIIAVLFLSPEAMAGLISAAENRLQRAVNIYLGSVTATIGLTIPAALFIGLYMDIDVILGLAPAEAILLVVTLVVSMLTFASERTNVVHGAMHLVLFLTYILLIFD